MNVQLPDNSVVQFPDGMPTDQVNAAITSYLGQSQGPSNMEKGFVYANAPFSGLVNSVVDTGLGATQAIAGFANKIGVLPDQLNIGGTDYGYNAGNQGINDIKSIKDEMNADAMQDNTPAKFMFGAGNMAGNAAQFTALPGGYTQDAQAAINQLPNAAKYAATVIPAVSKGVIFGASKPAQDQSDRLTNAEISGGASGIGQVLGNMLSTQVTDPTKLAAMKIAEDQDIPVYRSQISDNPLVKAVASFEKEIPGSGASSSIGDQVGRFNSAVLNTIGQTGRAVTPEALNAADKQISGVYDDLTNRYDLPVNQDFLDKLDVLKDEGQQNLAGDKEAIFNKQINLIQNKVTNAISGAQSSGQGMIDGSAYQNLRSQISGLLRSNNGSPQLGKLLDLLDSQFQGAMAPEDADALQTARSQYRNMVTIENVVKNSPNEPITPSKLQGAVKNVFGNYAYGGDDDLEHLARLGNLLKDSFPNSGTATRNQIYDVVKHVAGPSVGVGLGAGEGYHESGTAQGALAGALLGYGVNKFGISPYLYSQMGTNPGMAQAATPTLAATLANYRSSQ